MEEVKKPKSLWEILKGTLKDIDGEGSNKRFASFFILTFMICPGYYVFLWEFHCVAQRSLDQEKSMYILKMHLPLIEMSLVFVGVAMGLVAIDQILNLIKIVKGQKCDDPKPAVQ